jgi:hypothetical protein
MAAAAAAAAAAGLEAASMLRPFAGEIAGVATGVAGDRYNYTQTAALHGEAIRQAERQFGANYAQAESLYAQSAAHAAKLQAASLAQADAHQRMGMLQAAQHHEREYEQALYQHAHEMNVEVRASIREGLRDDVTNKIQLLSAIMTIDALLLAGALTLVGADYMPSATDGGEDDIDYTHSSNPEVVACGLLCSVELLMSLIGAACFFLFLSLWFAFIGVRRVTRFKIVTRQGFSGDSDDATQFQRYAFRKLALVPDDVLGRCRQGGWRGAESCCHRCGRCLCCCLCCCGGGGRCCERLCAIMNLEDLAVGFLASGAICHFLIGALVFYSKLRIDYGSVAAANVILGCMCAAPALLIPLELHEKIMQRGAVGTRFFFPLSPASLPRGTS